MEQLKGGMQALKCNPKEQAEYLIGLQALKVPAKQWDGEAGDSFILTRKQRGKGRQHVLCRAGRPH